MPRPTPGDLTMPALRLAALAACLLGPCRTSFAETADETITRWYCHAGRRQRGRAGQGAVRQCRDQARPTSASRRARPNSSARWASGASRSPAAASATRSRRAEGDATTVLACYDFAENDISDARDVSDRRRADRRELPSRVSPRTATPIERPATATDAAILADGCGEATACLHPHIPFHRLGYPIPP